MDGRYGGSPLVKDHPTRDPNRRKSIGLVTSCCLHRPLCPQAGDAATSIHTHCRSITYISHQIIKGYLHEKLALHDTTLLRDSGKSTYALHILQGFPLPQTGNLRTMKILDIFGSGAHNETELIIKLLENGFTLSALIYYVALTAVDH